MRIRRLGQDPRCARELRHWEALGDRSTFAKVHKHAFGGPQSVEVHCIGRSKGGANTKINALVDARGRAVRLILGAGNRHDSVTAPELVAGQDSRTILADKAYGSAAFGELLESLGLQGCIPPKANNAVRRSITKVFTRSAIMWRISLSASRNLRAIATRFEKPGTRFLDLVKLAAICDWLKNRFSNTPWQLIRPFAEKLFRCHSIWRNAHSIWLNADGLASRENR